MRMTKADAARILDPETSRKALAFLEGRPHIIDTLKQEACRMGAAALRPVSRERVEQTWSGRWIEKDGFGRCSACGWGVDYFEGGGGERFCSGCGRAMTDEAVDIVLSRLEALKDAGN